MKCKRILSVMRLTHHMARLAGRGNHHTVTDGESQEEVGDVGELQTG